MVENSRRLLHITLFVCAMKVVTKVALKLCFDSKVNFGGLFWKKKKRKQIFKAAPHEKDKEYQRNVKEYHISSFLCGNILLRIQFEDISSLYCKIIKLTTP